MLKSFRNLYQKKWKPETLQLFAYRCRTNETTESIVRQEIQAGRVASYDGCAPRYCPSIEVKITRFPGRSHQVWLEPEGHDTSLVYPNGLSNGLNPDAQHRMLRSIPGLQDVEMVAPGYSV